MKFTWYMFGIFLKIFLMMTLGAIMIFAVIDFVGNIRMWLSRGMQDTLEYYLNYLPYILYLILPISLLISVVVTLGGMSRHLELTAIQGAGRSGLVMLRPLLVLGLALSFGMYWMGETILPDANFRRLELAQPGSTRKKVSRVKEKSQFVFVSSDKHSWYFQFYSSQLQEARKVILLCLHNGDVAERYDAENMIWAHPGKDTSSANGFWEMRQGFRRRFLSDGSIQVEPFAKMSLKGVVPTRPEDIIFARQTGDEMNTSMIRQRISAQKRSGEDTAVLETQLYFKYSGPFMALITLMIGAALSHRYSRSGGISTKFGIGLFISFGYYIVFKIGLQMGEGGVVSPMLGAWIGNIVFGFFALLMLVRSFRL